MFTVAAEWQQMLTSDRQTETRTKKKQRLFSLEPKGTEVCLELTCLVRSYDASTGPLLVCHFHWHLQIKHCLIHTKGLMHAGCTRMLKWMHSARHTFFQWFMYTHRKHTQCCVMRQKSHTRPQPPWTKGTHTCQYCKNSTGTKQHVTRAFSITTCLLLSGWLLLKCSTISMLQH